MKKLPPGYSIRPHPALPGFLLILDELPAHPLGAAPKKAILVAYARRHAVERGGATRPAHRPPFPPGKARVVKAYRVAPVTAAAIEAESKRSGESQGQVVDRLAAALKPKSLT